MPWVPKHTETVATHDLAKGMLTGVILPAVFFARKVGRMLIINDIQSTPIRASTL
jgi:MFS superfamily sulfate permease-like transporter